MSITLTILAMIICLTIGYGWGKHNKKLTKQETMLLELSQYDKEMKSANISF